MAFGRNLVTHQQAAGVRRDPTHTSQMVSFQMINAREGPLTDRAAKMLLGGLHGGPSGRRSGVIRKRVRSGEEVKDAGDLGRRYWYCIGR
jgi:hypothetical protein